MARKAEEQMVGGVDRAIGAGGVPTAPRKYTRLHLFNARGLRVLHGIVLDKTGLPAVPVNPGYPHYAGRQVMIRSPGQESVFVSVIEPFAGEPFIKECGSLPIAPGAGARRPVAIELKVRLRTAGTASGERIDLLAAGASEWECSIPAAQTTWQGEFALIQRDGNGIAKAVLVGGRKLKTADLEIATAQTGYRAKIAKVDYRTREVTLDRLVPAAVFRGAFVEIGDGWTSPRIACAGTPRATACRPRRNGKKPPGAAPKGGGSRGLTPIQSRTSGRTTTAAAEPEERCRFTT
jgi:hypothetical protein